MSEPFYAPRFAIRVSGLTMAADVTDQVLRLSVETDLDLAGTFSLTMRNPDNNVLDSALFDLGKTVEIHLGYGDELVPAFLGEVAGIEPSFPSDGPPVLQVSGYDRSYRLRRSYPEPVSYTYANDSLLAARIAVEHGLIPVVDPTAGFEETVSQSESDMAFLKRRARQYHFDVFVEWDRLHFQFPRPQTAAHVLEWGRNLSSFEPRISSAGLAGVQVVRGYNQELAQTVYGVAAALDFDVDNLEEKLGGAALDLLGTMVRKGIADEPVSNPLKAAEFAKALLDDLLDGMYEGTGSCIGVPTLAAGQHVVIQGVGKRFGGTYRLRKVSHRIDDSGFRTDFTVGQSGHSSLMGVLRGQLIDEPPPDGSRRIDGVVVGTVVDNDETKAGPTVIPLGRVKVRYPGLTGDKLISRWAPCARPMAGSGMGFYALPERDEQVLVAFEQGDLDRPVVLGSLWHAGSRPPLTNVDGGNNKRALRSRAGHMITFDDTGGTGKLTVEAKGGSSVTLDAADGSITINAKGDLTLKAAGKVSIEAAQSKTKIIMTGDGVDVT
ncbi:hypothetical protein JIG36_00305 [Actinoplanes sp. LDG1-06]|uniref:Gp5/Type VI secretion system Vgr protein OB-fold domain-containing protein n=1 Tax=Paractinoplanes ovalisporus TaxID=2810368 RepID=A0ABS2A2D1_9ACTN|nr:phage baseplate assembly protein V [Actinoplanes ovalisporus]MBM2613996.1 hypothetical protein [Actinoplanes ovalisporus]